MNFNDFSDLSSFIYSEFDKLQESFGINQIPMKTIRFVEKSIKKYIKLYDKPLYEKEKREIRLKIALDTMPHSWLWKIFNAKLWSKIKVILSQEKQDLDVKQDDVLQKPDIYVPAVIVPKDSEEPDGREFMTDF